MPHGLLKRPFEEKVPGKRVPALKRLRSAWKWGLLPREKKQIKMLLSLRLSTVIIENVYSCGALYHRISCICDGKIRKRAGEKLISMPKGRDLKEEHLRS